MAMKLKTTEANKTHADIAMALMIGFVIVMAGHKWIAIMKIVQRKLKRYK